ncbi:hypothetical protein [Clostridium saccharoperbutylacetonicum]|uniref:hypothetical protein n=1 Tax=Clostridium saccharoperbutylacetonicum TaxID=36745 RepID=UPI0039EB4FA8
MLQQDNDTSRNLSDKFSISSLADVMRLKGLISKEYVHNTFKEEMELVESFKPDLILGEFETVMPIVAKKMDIPYFCTGGTSSKKDFSKFGYSNKTKYGYEETYNELLKTCRKIIDDNEFKQNLKIYSAKIKSGGGAVKAADFILNY